MGMFEQFPYSNFHELNLDWLIEQIKQIGENAVLSVNGETGDVILYQSENIVFPDVDSATWRMVRTAGGHVAGVMFQNGLMYVMYDGTAERVYTVDHPPAYPVTSVDGQTGDVHVFPDAATRLPDVTQDYTNIRRQIQTAGVDNIVGVEVKADKAYRMKDASRYEIYDSGNTPPYPVTSVDGQTGDVHVFPDAATRLPDVTQDYTNIRRQIQTAGVDNIVGVEVKADKAYRMKDSSRYEIYDSGNTPPYPVTSVNGNTGAIVIAIPFVDPTDNIVMFASASNDHVWGLGRETLDGVASIQLRTYPTKAEAYLDFFDDNNNITWSRKLLTVDDIPSGSGVVSVNGATGVVTIYGDTMPIENGSQYSVKDITDDLLTDVGDLQNDVGGLQTDVGDLQTAMTQLATDIAIMETGNTATHNIAAGSYVVWKGDLYTANTAISVNDPLSATVLDAVSGGGLNALNAKLAITTQDVTTINNATGTVRFSRSGNVVQMMVDITPSDSSTSITFSIPNGYLSNGPMYDKRNIQGSNIYTYLYANNATVTISHTTNAEIVLNITYIGA